MRQKFLRIKSLCLAGLMVAMCGVAAYADKPIRSSDAVPTEIAPIYASDAKGEHYLKPVGTPVYSACDGEVVLAERLAGFGNCVFVRDAQGTTFYYCHLDQFNVQAGDEVSAGAKIGLSGNTGFASRAGELALYVQEKDGAFCVNGTEWEKMIF